MYHNKDIGQQFIFMYIFGVNINPLLLTENLFGWMNLDDAVMKYFCINDLQCLTAAKSKIQGYGNGRGFKHDV